MEQYFAKDYTGAPFVLFDAPHLMALAVITMICLSFVYFRDRWDEADRKRVRYGIAIFTLIAELSWHWWSLRYGT
jgi:uncharacterized membrane protein YwaF